jgi:hypothetical protein
MKQSSGSAEWAREREREGMEERTSLSTSECTQQ